MERLSSGSVSSRTVEQSSPTRLSTGFCNSLGHKSVDSTHCRGYLLEITSTKRFSKASFESVRKEASRNSSENVFRKCQLVLSEQSRRNGSFLYSEFSTAYSVGPTVYVYRIYMRPKFHEKFPLRTSLPAFLTVES